MVSFAVLATFKAGGMRALLLAVAVLGGGCAHSNRPGPSAETASPPCGPDSTAHGEARLRFEAGVDALLSSELEIGRAAMSHAIELVAGCPKSPLLAPSLYNLGVACEALLDLDCAADSYARYATVIAVSAPGAAAETRIALAGFLQRHDRFAASVGPLLEALSFADLPRVRAGAARLLYARSHLAANRLHEAAVLLDLAWLDLTSAAVHEEGADRWLGARLWVTTGEVLGRQARRVRLSADRPEEQARLLARRADLLEQAVDAYRIALHHRDPEWSADAALAMPALYQDLRAEVIRASLDGVVPAEAAAREQEAMRLTLPLAKRACATWQALVEQAPSFRLDAETVRQLAAGAAACNLALSGEGEAGR